jgi:hypothetical protein
MARNAPSNSTLTAENLNVRTKTRTGKELVLDRKREVIWQPDALQAAGPANLISAGTNNAELSEINTSEICGLTMDASTDSHGVLWVLPDTMDTDEDIYFRVMWSNSAAAGTGSAQFTIIYTELDAGTTAMAVGATALDTVIADQDDLAANVVQWTDDWELNVDPDGGILNGETLSITPGDDALAIHCAVTLTTITDATAYAIQAEFGRAYI